MVVGFEGQELNRFYRRTDDGRVSEIDQYVVESGTGVAMLGDLDGNGIVELAAGARWDVDAGSGAVLGDFEGEAAGIGAALMWTTKVKNTDLTIGVKWLHEDDTEKRLEGDHLYLNFTFSL